MTALDLSPARVSARAEWLATPRASAALYCALVLLAAAPIVWWPIPRGADLIDHWARLTLYRLAPGDPVAGLYRVQWGMIPNLGVDLLYLALSPALSPQATVRLALFLSIALPAAGAFAIHRALFDKISPTIWLVPALSYNVATTVGLVNFALGAGLALLGVAYALRRGEAVRVRDLLALNLLGVALFFCHLIALAMFALLLGLIWAHPLRAPARDLARRALRLMGALALPLALVPLREAPPSAYSLVGKGDVSLLFAPMMTQTGWDQLAIYALAALASIVIWGGLRVAPRASLALPGFALVALLAPESVGPVILIDARLKVYVWYLALAAVSLKPAESWRPYLAAAAVALTALRLASVAPTWEAYQSEAGSVRQALAALPLGAKALVVTPHDCQDPDIPMQINLTTFAVIDRRAYVNTLFAHSGVQPVAPVDKALDGGPTVAMDSRWLTQAGRATLTADITRSRWAAPFVDWRRHFTHVIDAHAACASDLVREGLTRLGGASGFDVYRID